MNRLQVVDLPADRLEGEAVASFYFEDEKPLRGSVALLDWRLDGRLTQLLLDGRITGKAGEKVAVSNNGKLKADWILFFGGGKKAGMGRDTVSPLIRHLLETCRRAGFSRVALCMNLAGGLDSDGIETLVGEALEAIPENSLECSLSIDRAEN